MLPPNPDFTIVDYAKYHVIGGEDWSISWSETNSLKPRVTSSLFMTQNNEYYQYLI